MASQIISTPCFGKELVLNLSHYSLLWMFISTFVWILTSIKCGICPFVQVAHINCLHESARTLYTFVWRIILSHSKCNYFFFSQSTMKHWIFCTINVKLISSFFWELILMKSIFLPNSFKVLYLNCHKFICQVWCHWTSLASSNQ